MRYTQVHTGDMDLNIAAATVTVPKAKLTKLSTAELVGQYRLAISSWHGRGTNVSPRQKRIDYIVDMIVDRADAGDDLADAWLRAA